jgi:hypothetical protein
MRTLVPVADASGRFCSGLGDGGNLVNANPKTGS